MFDVRHDFPFLQRSYNGTPIIYFDNAATTQKPNIVIDTVAGLYENGMSNIHRAVSWLADEVTETFEAARHDIARFIGADPDEIIFVSNATHGLNLVCQSLSQRKSLNILCSTLEHHSNYLPWHKFSKIVDLKWHENGVVDSLELEKALTSEVDLVALGHASNFLGTIQPIEEILQRCSALGTETLIDASQSVAHCSIDVHKLNCDYLVFSGHKIYGPGGVGVLYVKRDKLALLQPIIYGGGMVKEVHADNFVENDLPYRFEPGTPNIEGVIGLAAALRYLQALGADKIETHERLLLNYAKKKLQSIPEVKIISPLEVKTVPIVTFQVPGLEHTGVTKILGNRANVIVRSGFHCTQPAHDKLGLEPTVRASFGIYNTCAEIDTMIATLSNIASFL